MPSSNDIMSIKVVEEHFKEQLGGVRKENEHLRGMVLRLNKELLKSNPSQDAFSDTEDQDEPLPPWVINSNYLSPLIESYEKSINDLNQEVENLLKEYRNAENQIKNQSSEISELRGELEIKYNHMLTNKNQSESFNNVSSEEKEEQMDHIEKLTEENNSLLLLNEKLTKRADDSTRELMSKGKELEEKLGVWNDLESALNCTRERELQTKHQKEMLENKLSMMMEEMGELEKDRDVYYSKLIRIEKDSNVLKNRGEKYEQAYKDSEAKRNEEIDALASEINIITTREKEAIQKCIMYERENEELREMRRELDNEISANRKEFDAMVRVMEDLESNLNAKISREDSIDALLKENNRKVEEALLERDRAVRRENTLLKTIEKLESDMRQQTSDLEYKYNNLSEGLRNKHKNLVKSKESELSELQQKITSLENQVERLERENRNYKNESSKYHENSKNMLCKTSEKLEEIEKKQILAESEKENVKNEFKQTNEQLKEEKRVHERNTRNLSSKMSSILNELDANKKEKSNMSDEVKRVTFRIEDLERERNLAIEDSESLRKMHSDKLGDAVKEFASKTGTLEKQLKESIERQRNSEHRAQEIIKLQEKLSDKWKKEHMATVKYQETMCGEYQGELTKYKQTNKEDDRFTRDQGNSADRSKDKTFERDSSFGFK